MSRYPEPTLDEVMYPEAWDLLLRLADPDAELAPREHESRAASTLYCLGLCTRPGDPSTSAWDVTPAGEDALVEHVRR